MVNETEKPNRAEEQGPAESGSSPGALPPKTPPAGGLIAAWTERATVTRALRVSAIVGTLLLAINQGDLILAGGAPPLWKILLTFAVPYGVSSWSSAAAMADAAAKNA